MNGLESVISPFGRFSQLISLDLSGDLSHTYGSSLLAAMTALVPRAIWPEKPVGLGAELAALFQPSLASAGHSELALFYGEWVWGFGIFGLVMMIPIIGALVRLLDTSLLRSMGAELTSGRQLLVATMLVILAASLVDLYWGGAHAYVARIGPRMLILGGILFVAWVMGPLGERRPAGPRRR